MGKTLEKKSRRPTPISTNEAFADEAITARRMDQLALVVDCCIEAQAIAASAGEKFLAYLLAMAIQETRGAMRGELEARRRDDAAQTPFVAVPTAAGSRRLGPRR